MATTDQGERVRVYLDTGSERSLITDECVKRLALAIRPNDTVLKGFGGYTTTAVGEVSVVLTIDGVELAVEALVTSCSLANAEVLLGQPTWATGGVTLVVQGGKAKLVKG